MFFFWTNDFRANFWKTIFFEWTNNISNKLLKKTMKNGRKLNFTEQMKKNEQNVPLTKNERTKLKKKTRPFLVYSIISLVEDEFIVYTVSFYRLHDKL